MAYLQHIQRGRFIQPFGCLLALDNKSLRVLAFSANAPDMLTSLPVAAVPDSVTDVPTIERPVLSFGCDVRSLFTAPGTAALQKAALSSPTTDLSLLNPILVHTRSSGRPFYAILHRVTRCIIVDLEPVKPAELPMSAAGALQSYKLAAKAIARIQSLPSGSLQNLCNAVVEEVFELTGYDRVMTYRFHDDDHGEVFAEITKPGLDPYLGLHYPATDIPQAARFLFMKNKVRMICDCRAKPVAILQDNALGFDITFCGSTLRAPHSCHLQYMLNMNSIASLVMAVVINAPSDSERGDPDDNQQQSQPKKRLWGLIVCHNESPRFVPFPLRYACEFLAQVFAIHVNKEFELENQIREKNILRTQTLLCDMLLKQTAPQSIISGSPNIMDLVKCDGAALLYQTKVWRLGVTPTESQIRHIAFWLTENHIDSTGLSTDSLHEAGYPGASALSDTVCGMAAAQINSKDILFWFRSHTAAEIRWGGAKHDPAQQDDGRKMHPRSSFKAFLEVVKMRSQPWKDYEMDAIHSLQLILRGSLNNENYKGKDATAVAATAALESKIDELRLQSMVELESVTNEMVRLIETASVPILAVDSSGLINGWNQKIAELTGLPVGDAIGKNFLSLIEEDSLSTVKNMLFLALQGKEEKNVQFQLKTYRERREDGPVILIVNVCCSRDINEEVVGACFVAQDMTSHKMVMDRFIRIEGDYKSIIQNPNPLIPPIFSADEFGWCTEWNAAMVRLSGWPRDEVIDKMLLGEVFGGQVACCHMKNQDAFVGLSIIINTAMTGQDMEKAPFGFYTRNGKFVECLLSVSKKLDGEGRVTGVFCFLHVTSHELQHLIEVQQLTEQTTLKKLKALAYIRQETRNPLSGMVYCQKMMDSTGMNQEQRKLIDIGSRCQRQLSRILDDLDLDSIMDSCLELEMVEFELQNVIMIAVSQVALPSQEKGVRLLYNLDQGFMSEELYGDRLRLQQIIADFLAVSVKFSPSGGLVEIASALVKQPVGQTLHLINLEITIKHSHSQAGSGAAEELVSQMFGTCDEASEEGLGLLVCRKLLRLMNGDVRYLRDALKSTFILSLELASAAPAKIYKPQPMRTFL